MTVAENIALAAGFPKKRCLIDWQMVTRQARLVLDIIGCDIDPADRVTDLSRTDRSIVAIARALATKVQVIVLDEPTASLPESEVTRLFAVLARMRNQGGGMVYVSHRLDEIFRIADRVTVMRDGRAVVSCAIAETTPGALVGLIAGSRSVRLASRTKVPPGLALLRARGLRAADVGPVDLAIRPGEIVALAGLRGAGQEAVGRALTGVNRAYAGILELSGKYWI